METKMLKDRVALVTGAGRGIGRGTALKFAENGAKVVLAGRHMETLESVKEEIEKINEEAFCVSADVTDEQDVKNMVQSALKHFGRIDILVNNAGMSREMPFLEMPVDIFDQIMITNFRSVTLVTRAVLPLMIAQKFGRIVNVGSGAAVRGLPGSTAYAASKAAVCNFTQALGDEIRKKMTDEAPADKKYEAGNYIRINAVCPGPVDTEMFQKSERREFILAAGGDVISTETMANAILFCASELSKGMNSQILIQRGFNRW